MDDDVVRIEQRLHDVPQFLLLPADEAAVIAVPLAMGLLGRVLLIGAIFSFVAWLVWKRLKGESGLTSVLAAVYWYAPEELTPFRALPDSSVVVWRA